MVRLYGVTPVFIRNVSCVGAKGASLTSTLNF